MKLSVRVSEADYNLFRAYASKHNLTLSEFIRETVMERIEDEYDLELYRKAMEEFQKNPVTYSYEEVLKELA